MEVNDKDINQNYEGKLQSWDYQALYTVSPTCNTYLQDERSKMWFIEF